jgi:glyoxylate reductase
MVTKPPILITKHIFADALEVLSPVAEVDYHDRTEGMSADELRTRAAGAWGLMCQLTDRLDESFFAACPGLRMVATVATGYDNIDVPAATRRSIMVTNTPGVLTDTTADLAFALLMAAARRIAEADRFSRSGQWREWHMEFFCGYDIHHKTIGLIGFGRIGQAMAQRAVGFSMRVLYHDTAPVPREIEERLNATFVPLDELLRQSDFVSLHVPLVPHTRHLIAAPQLALMKPSAILVNAARGPVVDEPALAQALYEGRIAAAGLDVFEQEPHIEPRLLTMPNVVLSPHIGSASFDTRRRMCRMAADSLAAALRGQRPQHLIDPAVHP